MFKQILFIAFAAVMTGGLYAQKTSKPVAKQQTANMSNVTEVQSYVHFHGAPYKGKILMVASSPATSKQTGWPIGFWVAELTHPLRVF